MQMEYRGMGEGGLSRTSWTETTVAWRADVRVTALGLPSAPIPKNKILPFLSNLEGQGLQKARRIQLI